MSGSEWICEGCGSADVRLVDLGPDSAMAPVRACNNPWLPELSALVVSVMFQPEAHQLSADLGALLLWCNRCGEHVPHDLIVSTDNQVVRTLANTYRDENRDREHRRRVR